MEKNPWNFFHNRVQSHIRYNKAFDESELEIVFNNEVENPVTKKKSTTGKADLSLETIVNGKKVTYLWEVKPASYSIDPKMTLGVKQLQNYLNQELRTDENNYVNGGTTRYITEGDFLVTASLDIEYRVYYKCMPKGLVLYWFESIDDDDEDESKDVEDVKDGEGSKESEDGKDGENDSSDPSIPIFPPLDDDDDDDNHGSGKEPIQFPIRILLFSIFLDTVVLIPAEDILSLLTIPIMITELV